MARIKNMELSVLDESTHKFGFKAQVIFGEADKRLKLKHSAKIWLFEKDNEEDLILPLVMENFENTRIARGPYLYTRGTGDDELEWIHQWPTFQALKHPEELSFEHSILESYIKHYARNEDDSTLNTITLELRAFLVVTNELNGFVWGAKSLRYSVKGLNRF